VARRSRSDYLCLLYLALGPERSLDRVAQMATELGVKVNRTTIAGYSRDFGWVDRAREYDERRQTATEAVVLNRAIADDVAHADFYRVARSMATHELTAIMDAAKGEGGERPDIRPLELVRMGDIAIKGERLISGKATDAVAIMTSAMTMLTERIGPSVRTLIDAMRAGLDAGLSPDELRRVLETETARFAREYDDLVEAEFRAYGLTEAREAGSVQ
jgi:hypothetical protein